MKLDASSRRTDSCASSVPANLRPVDSDDDVAIVRLMGDPSGDADERMPAAVFVALTVRGPGATRRRPGRGYHSRVPEIGPTTRDENLERLARDSFDVCVIGGGITGAGVALDAASRGLSVALVERGDFASGTSSKSSKMIHGGLRYLANYEFGLTYEASRERDLLRRLAPHLVRPLRFLFPAYKKGAATRFATIGLTMYDAVAAGRGFERHHRARARDIVRLAPTLDPARVVAAWTYYDASTDDARLVFEVLRTAHGFGATIANHITVEGFERSGGRIAAAQVLDAVAGRPFVVRARSFVNAAGVWAGEVGSLDGENPLPPLRPAKGIHLVVPSERIPVNAGIVIPSVARDGRSMFAVPWGPNTVLGTTDTEYSGSLDAPSVDSRDVTYMLDAVNWSLGVNLGAGDVVSAWAGLRPLLAGEGGPDTPTADLSRKAHLSVSPAGLVNITGGKLTTYRRMAADAVDVVCSRLGVTASSRTRRIPIGLTRPLDGLLAETRALAERIGIDPAVAAHLVAAHGDRGPAVIELALEDRSLAEPLAPGLPWIGAEAVWAVRREMAIGLPDVLERRTRLSLADPNAGLESAAPGLVARGRGWTEEELAAQVARVGAVVSAERGVVPGPGPARVTRP